MWAHVGKQQCNGAGEPLTHQLNTEKCSGDCKQGFLTATGTPTLPATAETEQEAEVERHTGTL